MNKNTIDKLVNNPHYVMSNEEIEKMASFFQEEAVIQKKNETYIPEEIGQGFTEPKKTNKNRVNKNIAKIDKHLTLGE